MKIAHIVCSYPPYFGGMGNVVFQTASELDARGHEVTVLTPGYFKEEEYAPADAPKVPTHEPTLEKQIHEVKRLAPSLEYGNAARLPTIAEELDDMDIVHLHYPFFGTANLVRKWKLRNPQKPLIITYHMDVRAKGWKGMLFKLYTAFWMPRILGVADACIGSSLDYIESSDARALYEKNKEKWSGIPFGVDTERFTPDPPPKELYEKYGFDPSLPTLLFVGGLDAAHFFKGVPILLRALHILKGRDIQPQMLIVGAGDQLETYKDQAKVLGLNKMVAFAGRVSDEDLPQHYQLADLCILPSTTAGEAFGMVLIEAMASGVPVLASDLPGVRTVACNGGDVVPPRDSVALADAISQFINQPSDKLIALRKHARDIAEQKYSWSPIVDTLEALYTTCIHNISR